MFLGDYVGYGADPGFAVDTVREFVERGAIALVGNHDSAAIGTRERMNDEAMLAIEWTRAQLDQSQFAFLGSLPLTAAGRRPSLCARQRRLAGAAGNMSSTSARRRAACTRPTPTGRSAGTPTCPRCFISPPPARSRLSTGSTASRCRSTWQRRWVAVIGAVGQPRDRNPAACYALFDDATHELTYVRVPYDIETAQRKIRDAGLPPFLERAARLGPLREIAAVFSCHVC